MRDWPPRRLCAAVSGVKLSAAIAFCTRARSSAPTFGWPLMTRETVPIPTPAASATSRMVGFGFAHPAPPRGPAMAPPLAASPTEAACRLLRTS